MRTPVTALTLCAILCGCAASTDSANKTAQLNCDALKQVVAAAPTGFEEVLGAQRSTRYGEVWRATAHALGGECSFQSGTDKPRSYVCTSGSVDQASALPLLVDTVATCLGPQWQQKELPRGGTHFSRPDSPVVVDVGASDIAASRASSIGLRVQLKES